MSAVRNIPPKSYFPLALVLAIGGWGGLILLWTKTLPTLGPRWLFFFLIVLAFTGTALPVTAFLNYRFPSKPPAGASVSVRQALWVGIYFATLAWLQYGRVFTLSLAVVLGIGLAAIEWLLRLRERARWNP
jgi:hypothetical protein